MKATLLFQDDTIQLILTPETDSEERLLTPVEEYRVLSVNKAAIEFKNCLGGWVNAYNTSPSKRSLIITGTKGEVGPNMTVSEHARGGSGGDGGSAPKGPGGFKGHSGESGAGAMREGGAGVGVPGEGGGSDRGF